MYVFICALCTIYPHQVSYFVGIQYISNAIYTVFKPRRKVSEDQLVYFVFTMPCGSCSYVKCVYNATFMYQFILSARNSAHIISVSNLDLGEMHSLRSVYVDNNPYLHALPVSLFSQEIGFSG